MFRIDARHLRQFYFINSLRLVWIYSQLSRKSMDLSLLFTLAFDPRVSCLLNSDVKETRSDEKERFFFHRSRGAFLNIAPVGNARRKRKTGEKEKRSMNEKQNSTLTIEKVFVR